MGWIWARLPINPHRARQQLDPVLGWLAFDGWGFHEGFFYWPKYISGQLPPKKLAGYEMAGLRSGAWAVPLVCERRKPRIHLETIGHFSACRQPRFVERNRTCRYVRGCCERNRPDRVARKFRPALAAVGARLGLCRQIPAARGKLDRLHRPRRQACFAVCPPLDAARLSDMTLENLPADAGQPAYEVWRQRLQRHFQRTKSESKDPARQQHHAAIVGVERDN